MNRSAGNPLPDEPWPVSARNLLSEREQECYQRLIRLYPDHKILVQVALSQLIDVDSNHPESESIRARYKQLVADFVLCRSDLSVVAVIEVDDHSHERPKSQAADARKNKALADAGIRLVRIPAGRLPSEESLKALISADGMGERIYPEEPALTLAEDTFAPASSHDSDEESEISREAKRVALKAVALVVLVACGWLFYSYLLPTLLQQAFVPLASTPVVAPPIAQVSAEERRARELQIVAQAKQKNLAFAAFYSPPASCAHPVDWSAQVECGNKYIRAKREFDQKWSAEHPSSQGGVAEVVLSNESVNRPRK